MANKAKAKAIQKAVEILEEDNNGISPLADDSNLTAEIVTLTDVNGKAIYPRTTTKAIVGYGDDIDMMTTNTDQDVSGIKTFKKSPIIPTPTNDNEATNKSYVDNAISEATPTLPDNLVTTNTDQTITGSKSFSEISLYSSDTRSKIWTTSIMHDTHGTDFSANLNIIADTIIFSPQRERISKSVITGIETSEFSSDDTATSKKYVDDSISDAISNIDLSPYATISSLDNYLTKELAQEQYVAISTLDNYALASSLDNYATLSSLDNYALKSSLDNYALKSSLSNYALKTDLSGYITSSDLSLYATTTQLEELQEEIVENVKIKTETVTLSTSGWNSSLQQTVTLTEITVSPSASVKGSIMDFPLAGTNNANSDAYSSAGIKLTAIPAENQLTFKCTTKPAVAIQTEIIVIP